MNWNKQHTTNDAVIGIAAGAVAGLLGSWTMNQFQAAFAHFKHGAPNQQHEEEPATAKTADRISRAVSGQALDEGEKKQAEPWVHYGFGALTGAAYGGLSTAYAETEIGAGTVYGSVVWLLADEIGVPAAGLSKPPNEIPPSKHLMALASHLVYGLTLYSATRLIRSIV